MKAESRNGERGFTLIEMMVASTILGMAIASTATILKAGQDLEYKKNLERQAWRLAWSALEKPAYHYYPNYNTLAGSTENRSVNLDGRPITMKIAVSVSAEYNEPWPPYNTTFYKRLDAKVSWTVEGVADTVGVTKVVAEVR